MKKILYILLIIICFVPSISLGQVRPDSVDNSAWFPPAEVQMHNNCSHFSLVYYLKSYIWNKHFQRNPNLPENQFSADFVWNQQIDADFHFSQNEPAFDLLTRQGCATVANFPLQTSQENIPNLEVREGGLNFRSAKLTSTFLSSYDSISVASWLNQLKDSLSQGVCFTMHIGIFPTPMSEVTAQNPFYNWNPGLSPDSSYFGHLVAVVGYDDNLQAFKMINSWGSQFGDNGYFYMGYDWFFNVNWISWNCYFLEEDFSHVPELSLNLSIQQTISGHDIMPRRNIFVDTVYYAPPFLGRFDYYDEYFNFNRLVTIKSVNNQIVPSSLTNYGLKNTNNIVFQALHDHNGNRQLLEDLTNYVSSADLNSLELLIVDPLSAVYIGENDDTIYSYVREANSEIDEAYIKFLGTLKRIIGDIVILPDTTIITRNFNSWLAGYHLNPIIMPIAVKTCTSVLKRKKITFSIADTINFSNPPYFTSKPSDTLRVRPGNQLVFQFKAEDPDRDLLKYSLSPLDSDVQIDSLSGLFQYQSLAAGVKQFTAIVSDGLNNVTYNFTVVCNTPPSFAVAPPDTLKGKPGTLISYQFEAQDTDGDILSYALSPLVVEAQLDPATGLFQYQSDIPAVKKFNLVVTDGHDKVSINFIVKVNFGVGIDDPENSPIATLAQNYPNPFHGNSTISFTLIKGGYVSLKVYNLLGKELNTLLSKEMNPGVYNIPFNARDLPAGIYTYRLEVNGFVLTKKMAIAD